MLDLFIHVNTEMKDADTTDHPTADIEMTDQAGTLLIEGTLTGTTEEEKQTDMRAEETLIDMRAEEMTRTDTKDVIEDNTNNTTIDKDRHFFINKQHMNIDKSIY